jgi:uncharacterized protein (DUF697 family)
MTVQESQARRTVNKYMWWSMGAGLIPFPWVDLAAVTGLQLRMLSVLSNLYEVPFSKNRGKSVISALLGSIVPTTLARGVVGSSLKLVPVIGPIAGAVAMPTFTGAATYAIGKVYIMHCEAGGTLLDLQPARMREYFQQQFEEGQEFASEMQPEQEPKEGNPA